MEELVFIRRAYVPVNLKQVIVCVCVGIQKFCENLFLHQFCRRRRKIAV